MYGLPSVQVDLGASFVHGCHEYNPLFVIAKSNKVTLNNAGGGYSAGWSENAAWYNAVMEDEVKPATVTRLKWLAKQRISCLEANQMMKCHRYTSHPNLTLMFWDQLRSMYHSYQGVLLTA